MVKAVFSASLLQASVSQDFSEIIGICLFNQFWKQLCCLIFIYFKFVLLLTVIIFQDSLNKVFKKNAFIYNINNFLTIHTTIKKFGFKKASFLFKKIIIIINTFIQQGCVKLLKSSSKVLYC